MSADHPAHTDLCTTGVLLLMDADLLSGVLALQPAHKMMFESDSLQPLSACCTPGRAAEFHRPVNGGIFCTCLSTFKAGRSHPKLNCMIAPV
eukprot:5975864-Amphidinium_carterae.1